MCLFAWYMTKGFFFPSICFNLGAELSLWCKCLYFTLLSIEGLGYSEKDWWSVWNTGINWERFFDWEPQALPSPHLWFSKCPYWSRLVQDWSFNLHVIHDPTVVPMEYNVLVRFYLGVVWILSFWRNWNLLNKLD